MTKTTKTTKTKTAQNTFAQRVEALRAHRLAETSADMQKVLGDGRSVFAFTESVNAKIDALGIDTASIFAPDRNPKVIKRFIQFIHAINAGDYKSIDITTAVIIYSLHLAGDNPLTTDALHYLGAGIRDGKVSPETRGVNRTTVSKLFGAVGLSTVPTQASRTVGRNGFLQLAGATVGEPGKQNQKVSLVASHPLVVAFFECMNKATQGQIDDMVNKGK